MIRSFVFVFILPLCVHAQAVIQGTVTDPAGAPVAGAELRLTRYDNSLQRVTRTSAEGRYTIDSLPAGDYWLEAHTGTLAQAQPVALKLESGSNLTTNISLDLARVETRIQVTGSSMAQSTVEAGKAMDVLDSTDLDRRQTFSVVDALSTVPGLRVQQLGGPGTFARILTRGLRATDTSVLIDGMRLRDAGAVQGDAAAFLGDLLLGGIDQVEILRGSGSSLYGTHATGGVINLVTQTGGGPFHADLSNEGGGLGLYRGLAHFSGGALRDALQFAGGINYLNVSSGTDGIERVRNWSGQGSAQYRLRPTTTLSVRLFELTSMVGVTTNPQPAPDLPSAGLVPAIPNVTFIPNQFDPDSRRVANVSDVLAAWSEQLAPRATLRVSYQGLFSNRDNLDGPAGPGFQPQFNTSTTYGGRVDTFNARIDAAFARYHWASAGYEFERESYNNPSKDANPDPAQRVNANTTAAQSSNSIFAQDQLRWLENRLQLSLSGRFQRFSLSAPTFTGGAPQYAGVTFSTPPDAYTGDAALSYILTGSTTKFRAHAGNAYRAPSLYERFGAYFYGGYFGALGDPRLHPERSIGFDFGVDQYFAGNKLRASATYFYTRLQEVIGFGDTPDDPFGRYGGYVNTGGALARGVELSAEARPARNTSLQASYTYTNAIERNSPFVDGTLASIRFFPHQVTAVATQQITRRLTLTADWLWGNQYIGGTFYVSSGFRPYLFDGPRKFDAAANYTQPINDRVTARFFVRAENLLNQHYYEDGFRTPGVWATVGVKLMF